MAQRLLILDDETREAWLVEPGYSKRSLSRGELDWLTAGIGRYEGRFQGGAAVLILALVMLGICGALGVGR